MEQILNVKTRVPTAIFVALLLCLASLAIGCRHSMGHGVKGSGKRQTEKRDLPAFTSILTEGAFDIQVVCQKEQSVQLEADDNILPLIKTEVSNGVLRLRPTKDYSIEDSIVIKITVPNLERLTASGAGKLEVTGIKNAQLALDISGAPTVTASGETGNLTIEASGAGKIDAHNLKAAKANVEANGVAQIEVDARERLDVQINGPAKVIYSGDPELNETINGPGTLEKRESKGV